MSSDKHCLAQLSTSKDLALEIKAIATRIQLKVPETQELALLMFLVLTGRIRTADGVDRYLPDDHRAAIACKHLLHEGDLYRQPVFTDALRANERSLARLNETTRDALPEPVIVAIEELLRASRQLQEVIDFDSTVEGVRAIMRAAEQLQKAIENA